MRKSDLKNYMIVESREGNKYIVLDDRACRLKGYIDLEKYNEDLTEKDFRCLDIVKVYEIDGFDNKPGALEFLFDYNDECLTLIWEEKPKIKVTEDEKAILRNIDCKYKYIVRDMNKALYLYENKPFKRGCVWEGNPFTDLLLFNHLFQMVQWEDEEPTLIADLLKEGEW